MQDTTDNIIGFFAGASVATYKLVNDHSDMITEASAGGFEIIKILIYPIIAGLLGIVGKELGKSIVNWYKNRKKSKK